MPDSPASNGRLVRFVGRHRIQDGSLLRLLTCAKLLLPPWLLLDLLRARRARDSWAECLLQLYSLGPAPPLPAPRPDAVRFVCVSDTHLQHGKLPPLPPGDVLVHCGDFTNFGSLRELRDFLQWFGAQPHGRKLAVPGNHDMLLDGDYYEEYWGDWSVRKESHAEALAEFRAHGVELLLDSSVEVSGLRIHGAPWVPRYAAWRTAFNREAPELQEIWQRLPRDIDVLLTHSPPHGCGDREADGQRVGCKELAACVAQLRPKLHVFGHVHADYGLFQDGDRLSVNAACVSDAYLVGGRRAIVVDVPHDVAPAAES